MQAPGGNWAPKPARSRTFRQRKNYQWTGTKQQLLDRYGPSTSSVKRAWLNKQTREELANMLENRRLDAYDGSGRYRKRRRVRGRRYYKGRGGYWGRTIGGALGKAFNAPWMAGVGDKLGDFVSDTVPKLMGNGMYAGQGMYAGPTSSNSLVVGPHNEFTVPQFTPQTDGSSVIISHKEYVGDFYAPGPNVQFANQTYKINPGLESTFPWLAQVAQNYVEYKIHQLIFSYKSTVADFAAASGQVGQIIGVTQYDANSKPFTEKRSMMEYDASQSCKTSSNLVMGVECDPTKNAGAPGKYIRTTPLEASKDLNQYDVGTFNIAAHDTPTTYENQVLGEIWVSYTVELRKPKVFTAKGMAIQQDIFSTLKWNAVNGENTNIGVGPTVQPFEKVLEGERNTLGCAFIRETPNAPANVANPDLQINKLIAAGKLDKIGSATTWVLDDFYKQWPSGLTGPCYSYRIVIPATYTGNVNFELLMGMQSVTVAPRFHIVTVGNIKRINDKPVHKQISPTAIDDTYWSNGFAAFGSNNPGSTLPLAPEMCIVSANLRISQATDGVDNEIMINFPSSSAYYLKSCAIKISEYNTIGNFEQDGTDDRAILVNDAGQRESV